MAKSKQDVLKDARKLLAFDEAVANLREAGLADKFISAIEKDPELLKALEGMAPEMSLASSPGWSCCVTVRNPV